MRKNDAAPEADSVSMLRKIMREKRGVCLLQNGDDDAKRPLRKLEKLCEKHIERV